MRQGERVEQGQRIGAVGATGWATGPHLHFEFRVNGEHQDPLSDRAGLRGADDSTPALGSASSLAVRARRRRRSSRPRDTIDGSARCGE